MPNLIINDQLLDGFWWNHKHYIWMNGDGNAHFAYWLMGTPQYSWCPCVARKKRRGQWTFRGYQDRVDLPTQEGYAAAIFHQLYKIGALGSLCFRTGCCVRISDSVEECPLIHEDKCCTRLMEIFLKPSHYTQNCLGIKNISIYSPIVNNHLRLSKVLIL